MAYGKATSKWTIIAPIMGTLGSILTIVAYCTPYWIQSFTERRTGVNSMGLWEICFGQDFAAPWHVQDELGRRYADCNYMLSYELRTLRNWLFPAWFIAVEILMAFAMLSQLIAIIFALVYIVHCWAFTNERYALFIAGILNLSAGLMIAVAAMVYSYFSGEDTMWLPYPESNYLSWSFGICVVGGAFAILAAMFFFVDFSRLKVVSDLERRIATYSRGNFSRY